MNSSVGKFGGEGGEHIIVSLLVLPVAKISICFISLLQQGVKCRRTG